MLTLATGIAGKALGWLLGNPLILGAILIFLAYNFGYWLGERDGTRDMVSKLEIASLEAKLANIENEKKIAEAAAKQAEEDRAAIEQQASFLAGEVNDYKAKLAAAGRKCELTPDDKCDIYGVPKGCRSKRKKTGDSPTGVAGRLYADLVRAVEWRCASRPETMRRNPRYQCGQAG